MKKLLIFTLILFSCNAYSQMIDSVSVVRSFHHKIFIRVIKPEQVNWDRIVAVSRNDAPNTQFINILFKGCPPAPPVFSSFDTIIDYYTWGWMPERFFIRTFRDTMAGCSFPTEPMFMDSVWIYNSQIISISEFGTLSDQISLFPNPCHGMLKLEKPENLNIDSMELVDVMGRTVLRFGSQAKELDLSALASGTYSLVITVGQEKIIKKIFKH